MTTVVARTHIVEVDSARLWHIGVLMKLRIATLAVASKTLRGEAPRHPVGHTAIAVVRHGVARAAQYLFGHRLKSSRNLQVLVLSSRSSGCRRLLAAGRKATLAHSVSLRILNYAYSRLTLGKLCVHALRHFAARAEHRQKTARNKYCSYFVHFRFLNYEPNISFILSTRHNRSCSYSSVFSCAHIV